MSLYQQLERLDTSDLDDLAQLLADLVETRGRRDHAVADQELRASADAEAEFEGARTDSLTEDLEKALVALLPQLAEPTTLRSAA